MSNKAGGKRLSLLISTNAIYICLTIENYCDQLQKNLQGLPTLVIGWQLIWDIPQPKSCRQAPILSQTQCGVATDTKKYSSIDYKSYITKGIYNKVKA